VIIGAIAPGIIVVLFLEIILRLGAFLWFDYSQYYLYYGFHKLAGGVAISPWSTSTGQHYKFPPHYVLQDAAGQASETAAINSLGFRGPEFQAIKPDGLFRIVCMGESSTFGFHNSDTGTYPFQLGKLFQERLGGANVEVINAGFPYYNSGSILSLLREEIVNYRPDVLTLYNAYNDAGWPFEVGTLGRVMLWLQQHSIIYALMKNHVITDRYVLRAQRWLQKFLPQNFDQAQLEQHMARMSIRYYKNMKAIVSLAKGQGISVILIKQPMTTTHHRYSSLTYEEEYLAILARIQEKKHLTSNEYQFIKHHHLIQQLDKIAAEENIPIVDNITIVDQDRRRLASWVHLTEEANLRLAEALEAMIEPYIEREFAVSRRHE
jgi:lysophospholipase L1-like esterase